MNFQGLIMNITSAACRLLVRITSAPFLLLFLVANVHGLGRTVLEGHVYIQFIGAIYSNASCTTIESETVQNIQAIKWTLSKLNEADYIPNLDIGKIGHFLL